MDIHIFRIIKNKAILSKMEHSNFLCVQYRQNTPDSYDMMRKFAIILLNDILKDRNSRVRREFVALMQPGDEDRIRELFSNQEFQQDDDITVSVDQSESLYQAIAHNGLEFPKINVDGKYDKDELMDFLERLCKIFKWEVYEFDTLGHVGKTLVLVY